MRKFVLRSAIILASVAASASAFAQSCPMCKESMTAAGAKLSDGFYLSIMSMFFLPFAIGGTIAALVFQSWYERRHPEQPLPFPRSLLATVRTRRAK